MTTQEINQILEKMREADVIRVDKANMIFVTNAFRREGWLGLSLQKSLMVKAQNPGFDGRGFFGADPSFQEGFPHRPNSN